MKKIKINRKKKEQINIAGGLNVLNIHWVDHLENIPQYMKQNKILVFPSSEVWLCSFF